MLISWFQNRTSFETAIGQLDAARRQIERHIESRPNLTGYCTACRAITEFEVKRNPSGWTNLREAIVCPTCGLNGRMRTLDSALDEAGGRISGRFHILERFTPFSCFSARNIRT